MKTKEMLQKIKSVLLCLSAHPDNEQNSEFEDRIEDLIEIEEYLKSIKEYPEWIKIESESDLPEETGTYFTMAKTSWSPFYRIDVFTGRLKNSFQGGRSCFTHYQPIQKPKPPLF